MTYRQGQQALSQIKFSPMKLLRKLNPMGRVKVDQN